VGQRWRETAAPVTPFDKFARFEGSRGKQLQEPCIDRWPSALHYVERQSVTIRNVCMRKPKAGINSEGQQRDPSLGLKQGV